MKPGPYLDVVQWNCYVANRDDTVLETLRGWADKHAPDAFVLSEAASHADVLGMVRGYTVIQETPRLHARRGDDTGDCAILVADDVKVVHSRVIAMLMRWMVFSHHRWHDPHRYQVARLRVRGTRWRVLALHFPTGGFDGGNPAAFIESARMVRRWLRATVATPSVAAGDLNEKAPILADWFGPRFKVFGKGIDVAVTRGVRRCEWAELSKGGGDHHGRHYRFET